MSQCYHGAGGGPQGPTARGALARFGVHVFGQKDERLECHRYRQ